MEKHSRVADRHICTDSVRTCCNIMGCMVQSGTHRREDIVGEENISTGEDWPSGISAKCQMCWYIYCLVCLSNLLFFLQNDNYLANNGVIEEEKSGLSEMPKPISGPSPPVFAQGVNHS